MRMARRTASAIVVALGFILLSGCSMSDSFSHYRAHLEATHDPDRSSEAHDHSVQAFTAATRIESALD